MTEIERKALELVNEIEREEIYKDFTSIHKKDIILNAALHRAIEQHEAFRQELSDAVVEAVTQIIKNGNSDCGRKANAILSRFIITKPDPLVEAWLDAFPGNHMDDAREECEKIRSALAKRGLEIKEKEK